MNTQDLFAAMQQHFTIYPKETTFDFEQTLKQGFFPACTGTIDGSFILPKVEALIIGQDFGTLKDYKKRVEGKGENTESQSTWRQLMPMLNNLGVNPQHCFYSNYLMGLRNTEKGNVGVSTSLADTDFVGQCKSFLELQIKVLNPRKIIFLGKVAYGLSKDLNEKQIKNLKFIEVIRIENALKPYIKNEANEIPCVYMIHPSYRDLNMNKGFWKVEDETGNRFKN
ncbi:MAG: uracil-DNA glycosylase family protein [Bacteroidia bacterium]|nr:uracil-DNA glycosylase family protein [Bacteroidia bacterium]